jgi:hypothetical protein
LFKEFSMKKNTVFLKAAGMAAALGLLVLAGCLITAEGEEGETQKSAVLLAEDTWADGAVSSTSGEQWFRFTATAGTQYLHVMFGTMTSMRVQLYDSSNAALGSESHLSGSSKYLPLTVVSGRSYYVKVSEGSSWAGSPTGTYRIGFNAMPGTEGPHPAEPWRGRRRLPPIPGPTALLTRRTASSGSSLPRPPGPITCTSFSAR